jgi:hypothetical protein
MPVLRHLLIMTLAASAKNITNKPRINEDPKDAMLREFQEEIQRLKAALMVRDHVFSGVCAGWLFTSQQVAQQYNDFALTQAVTRCLLHVFIPDKGFSAQGGTLCGWLCFVSSQ